MVRNALTVSGMSNRQEVEMSDQNIQWCSWASIKAGNDGRRDSGKVWQRTKYNHAVKEGECVTLCKREIGCLKVEESRHSELPRCKVCEKRMSL